ncbi:MAG TPA: Hsp20/alpha crystallin family protein [Opitutaceae bacterium]|nr:Hsp20/alpha crystallin family protein [Opitutaceae bacterium]
MSRIQNLIPSFTRKPAERDNNESTVRPWYEVKETAEAWGLTVYLPGVSKEGLELAAEEGVVTVRGRRSGKAPVGWTALYRESADAPYELVLSHDNTVDVNKIHAELKDGVLRVSLPKAEAIKPRKIAVS